MKTAMIILMVTILFVGCREDKYLDRKDGIDIQHSRAPVPEPITITMLATGVTALYLMNKNKKRR